MTEENLVREQLLKSIEETAWLLESLKEAVADAKRVNVALYRSVQFELTQRNAALVYYRRRVKSEVAFEEAAGAEPDYTDWARKHWTIYEATALASGRKPETVEWDELPSLLEWLATAVKDKRLNEPMKPQDFLDWFDSLEGDNLVPPKLRRAIVAHRLTFSGRAEPEELNERNEEAEADIQAVRGSSKRAFESTQILLEYFMRSGETVHINPDPQRPPVSYSDADNLKSKLAIKRDTKTVHTYLNLAVKTVRRIKSEGVARQPKANRRK